MISLLMGRQRPGILQLLVFAAAAVLLGKAGDGRADEMDAATLQKIKRATVHLQVKLIDGSVAQGSGFFSEAPGVILTNAHVLGMLAPNSRRPLEIIAVINSGEAKSQRLPATILAVDRNSDLAALRVEGKNLPAPLQVADSKVLRETQDVYIFGFPFGDKLGKNITASKSSVSSLRKQGNVLKQIQVNGGMHPGNSGGPVTSADGQVIGVAVSGLKNTQIHFAIPTDAVQNFLSGRSTINLGTGHRFKDGDQIKLPVTVDLNDPLGRNSKVAVEVWTGNNDKTRLGTGTKLPPVLPGDSAKQTTTLAYDAATGAAAGDVILPPVGDVKQVYWVRVVITDTKGETRYYSAFSRPSTDFVTERKPVALQYQPKLGSPMALEVTSDSQLKVRKEDGAEQSVKCNLKFNFEEQSAKKREGGQLPVKLKFLTYSFSLFIDDKPIPGNDAIKKMLNDLFVVTLKLHMDMEGSQSSGGADLTQVPKGSLGLLTDVTDQLMPSLEMMAVGLPSPTLTPQQTWKTQRDVEVGPLGFAVPARADLTYSFVGIRVRDNKPEAVIHVEGSLRGPKGLETRVAGKMSGNLHLSTETGQVVDGALGLRLDCDIQLKGQTAKANGSLFVSLKRNPPTVKKQ
jgi:S1-C subfamily serine protease